MSKNKESSENVTERGRRFYDRMRKNGFVRYAVWVPKHLKEKVKEFVSFLKDKE